MKKEAKIRSNKPKDYLLDVIKNARNDIQRNAVSALRASCKIQQTNEERLLQQQILTPKCTTSCGKTREKHYMNNLKSKECNFSKSAKIGVPKGGSNIPLLSQL